VAAALPTYVARLVEAARYVVLKLLWEQGGDDLVYELLSKQAPQGRGLGRANPRYDQKS
jgi:hypothetical protein